MNRLARVHVGLALAAVTLAALAALLFIVNLVALDEVCYGMRNVRLVCEPASPGVAARLVVVLVPVMALYLLVFAGARWQQRATDPSARSTAYGLLITAGLLLVGLTMPALGGPGFFLLPATALVVATMITGTIAILRPGPRPTAEA